MGIQGLLHFKDYELEDRVVHCLTECVSVRNTSHLVVSFMRDIFKDDLFFEEKDFLQVLRINIQAGTYSSELWLVFYLAWVRLIDFVFLVIKF